MVKIVKYQNKDNETRYKFRLYAGVDNATGKQRYIKRTNFTTKKQASEELEKIQYELKTGQYYKNVTDRMHFKDVCLLWLEQYKNTVKRSTYSHTKRNIEKHILPSLGDFYVDKITLLDCQRTINKIFTTAPTRMNVYSGYIRTILDYAKRLGLINKNVARDIIKPKPKGKIENKKAFYTREELNIFLNEAKKQGLKKYVLFRMLAYGGMRISELLALTWNDISFITNTISINKTIACDANGTQFIQTPKTKSSKRLLNMDNETMSVLKEYKNECKKYHDCKLIFTNTKGKFLGTVIVRLWNTKIANKAGLDPIKLHGFRHTHATLLLKSGVPIKSVQYRLGHSKIDTTLNIYAHFINDEQAKKVGDDFARYMSNTDPKTDPKANSSL